MADPVKDNAVHEWTDEERLALWERMSNAPMRRRAPSWREIARAGVKVSLAFLRLLPQAVLITLGLRERD